MSEDPVSREAITLIGKRLDQLHKLLQTSMMAMGNLGAKVDGLLRQYAGLSRRTDRISAHVVSMDEETLRRIENKQAEMDGKLDEILLRLEKQT